MKNILIALCLWITCSASLFAQSNKRVERGFACDIKDGYTLNDVVNVMKSFDWSEDTAPGNLRSSSR